MLDWRKDDDGSRVYSGWNDGIKIFSVFAYHEDDFVEVSIPRKSWMTNYFDFEIGLKYMDDFMELIRCLLDVVYDKDKDIKDLFNGYVHYIEMHCLLQNFNEVGHVM